MASSRLIAIVATSSAAFGGLAGATVTTLARPTAAEAGFSSNAQIVTQLKAISAKLRSPYDTQPDTVVDLLRKQSAGR